MFLEPARNCLSSIAVLEVCETYGSRAVTFAP